MADQTPTGANPQTTPISQHPPLTREGVRAQEFTASEPSVAERPPTSGSPTARLTGKAIAVILQDGFEQDEFAVPARILREAGARVDVLAPDAEHLAMIKGERKNEPAEGTKADKLLSEVSADDYDALLIPGGLASPDKMRASREHLAFVTAFMHSNKPVAAICHAAWLLADAELIAGKTITSWPNIRRDVERAGATWVDREVQQDGNLITSRKPADAEALANALIAQLLTVGRPV